MRLDRDRRISHARTRQNHPLHSTGGNPPACLSVAAIGMGDWAPAEAMAQLSRPGKVLLTGGSWFRET